MQRNLLFLIMALLCLTATSFAQTIWSGAGDGTSWDDTQNWESGALPAAGAFVEFAQSATITGTATDAPIQIKVRSGAIVVLDLDLTIGNGLVEEHAVVINANSGITFGTPGGNRNISINTAVNKQGVAIFGGSDNASVAIAESTTLNLLQGQFGINVSNPLSTLTIQGTVNAGSNVQTGIKSVGTALNYGTINFENVSSDGILGAGGTFDNEVSGVITITKPADDGLELKTGTVFTNKGTLSITVADEANAGNNGISIGTTDESATFSNESENASIDGGIGPDGRGVAVNDLGAFFNGGTISFTGGNSGSRFFVKGTAVNAKGATIELTDGRFNVNEIGSFTNRGMIKSTRDGSGGLANGTAVNEAFFDYENSNNFAVGMGMITDEGISVNDSADINIDAMESCVVKLTSESYEWFEDGQSIATADSDGMLTFPAASLMNDPAVLTTSYEGVEITIHNFCEEAFGGTVNVWEPNINVTHLPLFPTVVSSGQGLTVDLRNFIGQNLTFQLMSLHGQLLGSFLLQGGQMNNIELPKMTKGHFILRYQGADKALIGRFFVQ